MFYLQSWGSDKYYIGDTNDGVVVPISVDDLNDLIDKGIRIVGVSCNTSKSSRCIKCKSVDSELLNKYIRLCAKYPFFDFTLDDELYVTNIEPQPLFSGLAQVVYSIKDYPRYADYAFHKLLCCSNVTIRMSSASMFILDCFSCLSYMNCECKIDITSISDRDYHTIFRLITGVSETYSGCNFDKIVDSKKSRLAKFMDERVLPIALTYKAYADIWDKLPHWYTHYLWSSKRDMILKRFRSPIKFRSDLFSAINFESGWNNWTVLQRNYEELKQLLRDEMLPLYALLLYRYDAVVGKEVIKVVDDWVHKLKLAIVSNKLLSR